MTSDARTGSEYVHYWSADHPEIRNNFILVLTKLKVLLFLDIQDYLNPKEEGIKHIVVVVVVAVAVQFFSDNWEWVKPISINPHMGILPNSGMKP